jgi:hypothetical protein
LDYDVSLHKFVELVVVIPTSARSSKMESGCSSHYRFRFDFSASFRAAALAGLWPEIAGLTRTIASLFQSGFLSKNSQSGRL